MKTALEPEAGLMREGSEVGRHQSMLAELLAHWDKISHHEREFPPKHEAFKL